MPERRVFVPEGYEVALIDGTRKDPEFKLRPANPEHAPERLITVAENFFPPRPKKETEDERIAMAQEWRYLVIVTSVGCLLYQPRSGQIFPGPMRPKQNQGIGYVNSKDQWMIVNVPVGQYIYEQIHRVRLDRRSDLIYQDGNQWNLALDNLRLATKKLFTFQPSRQYIRGTSPD